ncbi:MAG TPA: type II toxin-antitoxin system mRNA interferase toxin, RelE/StbE family [Gammaproteobacteria bacterium]|jgi:addiction module RelE/StbE family toxin|nr:type II toxin-antitoxin system mRNA interferase toxin, RelE/StbE family [Gammaproteobacteria bacterium]MDP6734117.1 type II toxin-antitoxin system mRNA interferase toxin, RelE/StbE family [Gammaproteobacteria bacterium]HAJ75158.1 type II toxin-antitoxin system mRNA interferase toxin, RelE/StbE family [Gammaproteobacteria bacterium]|tara:strand:- start:2503 stop:2784 length:282 start_codon:yes stop_codon:yes gene_type:complete
MWAIYEHKQISRSLSSAPLDVRKGYEKWKDIVTISGPLGLRKIKGFRDESLSGKWKGFRSSRLNIQYRVIYKVEKDRVLVQVENVTPHDYRRK